MRKILITSTFLLIIGSTGFSQKSASSSGDSKTIVFWNLDKLYNTSKDPNTNDNEYLPSGTKQWTEERYKKKISDISDNLAAAGSNELPLIIGLAEIENQKVLEDLKAFPKLVKGNYQIVHYETKEPDGLDIALLLKKDEVEIQSSKSVPVTTTFDIKSSFRDILYAKCKLKGDNVLHIFVTHWPARTNEDQDELKRISSAIVLRNEVDNILNQDNHARIIIMGDFNDEPTNKSLIQMLNATNKRKNLGYRDLFNMMYDLHNIKSDGSYAENNRLLMFDQIIVSVEMFNSANGYSVSFNDVNIFRGANITSTDSLPDLKFPKPTYSGNKYIGGTGSHFPVTIVLNKAVK
jgi:hypothetical protein